MHVNGEEVTAYRLSELVIHPGPRRASTVSLRTLRLALLTHVFFFSVLLTPLIS